MTKSIQLLNYPDVYLSPILEYNSLRITRTSRSLCMVKKKLDCG